MTRKIEIQIVFFIKYKTKINSELHDMNEINVKDKQNEISK